MYRHTLKSIGHSLGHCVTIDQWTPNFWRWSGFRIATLNREMEVIPACRDGRRDRMVIKMPEYIDNEMILDVSSPHEDTD